MARKLKLYLVVPPRKRLAAIVLCLAISFLLNAQPGRDDSTRRLSDVLDSLVEPPPQPGEDYSEAIDTTVSTKDEEGTDYFLSLSLVPVGSDSIRVRKIPAGDWQAMRRDKAFWYADQTFIREKRAAPKPPLSAHPLFQIILWLIIVGGFAACIIMYLSNNNTSLFRKTRTIADAEMEEDTQDIFAINFQKEIDKATDAGNYRLAIRLMFLRQLKRLSDRNIIQYTQDKTNFDYLLQLRPTALYPDFFRLARNYEYSWYGQFDIDAEKFAVIRKDFENFDGKLN